MTDSVLRGKAFSTGLGPEYISRADLHISPGGKARWDSWTCEGECCPCGKRQPQRSQAAQTMIT